MPNCQKLLKSANNAPAGQRLMDICQLAVCYGFEYKGQTGSHRQYRRPGYKRLMNFQEVGGKVPEYQVKQLLSAIRELEDLDEQSEE